MSLQLQQCNNAITLCTTMISLPVHVPGLRGSTVVRINLHHSVSRFSADLRPESGSQHRVVCRHVIGAGDFIVLNITLYASDYFTGDGSMMRFL